MYTSVTLGGYTFLPTFLGHHAHPLLCALWKSECLPDMCLLGGCWWLPHTVLSDSFLVSGWLFTFHHCLLFFYHQEGVVAGGPPPKGAIIVQWSTIIEGPQNHKGLTSRNTCLPTLLASLVYGLVTSHQPASQPAMAPWMEESSRAAHQPSIQQLDQQPTTPPPISSILKN